MAPRRNASVDRVRTTSGVLDGFGGRHVALLGGVLTGVAALVGVLGYAVVPARMAMRVTVGPSLEPTTTQYLPRVVGLAVLPVLSGLLVLGDRILRERVPAVSEADPYYAGGVVATVATLACCQVLVVALNAGAF